MGLAFRCRKNKEREIDVQASAGEATDGETGVAKCEKLRPDIMLLHAVMMTLNGLDSLAKIKASVHHLMVLNASSAEEDGIVEQASSLGASGYI